MTVIESWTDYGRGYDAGYKAAKKETVDRVLEIIESVEEYKTYSGMGELEVWVHKDELIEGGYGFERR